jgi:NAD(P)-dependent dehydrogenase (short-subunit alcohol dehydrogenase family)
VNAISPGIIQTPGYNSSLAMTEQQFDQFVQSAVRDTPSCRPGTVDEVAKLSYS